MVSIDCEIGTRLETMPYIEIVGHNIFYIELSRQSLPTERNR